MRTDIFMRSPGSAYSWEKTCTFSGTMANAISWVEGGHATQIQPGMSLIFIEYEGEVIQKVRTFDARNYGLRLVAA